MPKSPHIDTKHEEIIRSALAYRVPGRAVWVFGSRAGETPKPHSDVDLVIFDGPAVPENLLAALKLDFEESDLPFRVDVVLWSGIPLAFQNRIKANHVVFVSNAAAEL